MLFTYQMAKRIRVFPLYQSDIHVHTHTHTNIYHMRYKWTPGSYPVGILETCKGSKERQFGYLFE